MEPDPGSTKTANIAAPPDWLTTPIELGAMSSDECRAVLAGPTPTVLIPLGSTEPHGPHLPLGTDVVLAEECVRRSVRALRMRGVSAAMAPAVPYGVTRFAQGFAGAVSLSPALTEQLVRELCDAYRSAGFALVCVTNHHLEPEHVEAITRATEGTRAAQGGVVFANQLGKRWGRTLSEEFRRGDCHAGEYESALMMAARPELVHEPLRRELPAVEISLSQAIRAGQTSFREAGMERAYTGAPSRATKAHGEEQYALLVAMVVTEVLEALGAAP